MRILNCAFGLNFVLFSLFAFAQNDRLHISYDIRVTMNGVESVGMLEMYEGSKSELYLNSDYSRSEIKLGTLLDATTIRDYTHNKELTLTASFFGKGTAIRRDIQDGSSEEESIEVRLENETKVVAGVTCKKATITNSDGVSTSVWYMESEKYENKVDAFPGYKPIPGIPLEYSMDSNKMRMTMIANEVKYDFGGIHEKELFSLEVPDGYKLK